MTVLAQAVAHMIALTRTVEGGLWDKDLIEEVMKYGKIEETSSIYMSKLKEDEK